MSLRPAAATGIHEEVLDIGGRAVTVRARRHRGARRITLRIDARSDCAIVTLPARTSVAKGIDFARKKADWLARRLGDLPPVTPFADGAVIPFKGEPILIRDFPLAGSSPELSQGVLYVSSAGRDLSQGVGEWLKGEARAALEESVAKSAEKIGHAPPPIGLRDPRTRWGSCSAKGSLSFSWRLIMAPPMVLDYVAAHEVAHLVHLNHGKRFKALLSRLAGREAEAKAWLGREGTALHRYG